MMTVKARQRPRPRQRQMKNSIANLCHVFDLLQTVRIRWACGKWQHCQYSFSMNNFFQPVSLTLTSREEKLAPAHVTSVLSYRINYTAFFEYT